jgi:endonuclease-8
VPGILDGRTLTAVEAYGKHLLYDWEGHALHIHLGLYGKFRRHSVPAPEPRGAVRLRAVGEQLAFDLNGPTACELLSAAEVTELLDRLGADPLRSDADPEKVWTRLRRTSTAIGAVLMNQAIIAGVGNVYRSEILHLLHIHPERKASALQRSEFDDLWRLTVELLRIGKRYNRIIIADPQTVGKGAGANESGRTAACVQERRLLHLWHPNRNRPARRSEDLRVPRLSAALRADGRKPNGLGFLML